MELHSTRADLIASLERSAAEYRARYSERLASNARDYDRCEGRAEGLERAAWMLSILVERPASKHKLAKAVRAVRAEISKHEKAKRPPSPKVLKALAKARRVRAAKRKAAGK